MSFNGSFDVFCSYILNRYITYIIIISILIFTSSFPFSRTNGNLKEVVVGSVYCTNQCLGESLKLLYSWKRTGRIKQKTIKYENK